MWYIVLFYNNVSHFKILKKSVLPPGVNINSEIIQMIINTIIK